MIPNNSWYKRSEFGLRAAIFFSAATVSGAFGGLLAVSPLSNFYCIFYSILSFRQFRFRFRSFPFGLYPLGSVISLASESLESVFSLGLIIGFGPFGIFDYTLYAINQLSKLSIRIEVRRSVCHSINSVLSILSFLSILSYQAFLYIPSPRYRHPLSSPRFQKSQV